MGDSAALVDLIVEHTRTCYTRDRKTRHAWGYGCDQCPTCGLRAKGWEGWQQQGSDPFGRDGKDG